MHSLVGGQVGQSVAVESDAVVAYQVGILLLLHTVGGEVDAAVLLVHLQHLSYIPFPFGDLVRGSCRASVVHIQVVPVVAFAHPDEAFAVLQVVAEVARVVHVLVAGLFHQRAHLSGFGR